MNKFLTSSFVILFSLLVQFAFAQGSWATLLYTDHSGQHQLTSRIDTSNKIVISLGGASSFFSNSFSLNDVSSVENNIRTIDIDLAKGKFKNENSFQTNIDLNVLHLDYRLKKGTIRAGYGYRSFTNLDVDKSLFDLMADGNEQFIGQSIAIGPNLHLINFHQFYLGYSGSFGAFSFGTQVKFLSGIGHLQSLQTELMLNTSDDIYQISLESDYELQTSRILKYNNIDDITTQFSNVSFKKPFKGNYGYGIDLGLSYTFEKGHRVFANVYDIGAISWTNLTRNYKTTGTYNYDGFDVIDFLNSDDNISVVDSLKSLLAVQETLENYSSTLPNQFVLGFDYIYKKDMSFSALVSSRQGAEKMFMMYQVSGKKKFSEKLSIGISYGFINGIHAVGAHGSLTFGKLKIVAATDQITSAFSLASSRLASGRLGISYFL